MADLGELTKLPGWSQAWKSEYPADSNWLLPQKPEPCSPPSGGDRSGD